jgi:beta-glucosidase
MNDKIKYFNLFVLIFLPFLFFGQQNTFPFQNPDLDPEIRAEDMLKRLTLEEKVSQMQDVSPAIERLNIPEYNWWNECLHGVARAGAATSFPQAIGMAATWNTDLIHRVADVISTEARAKFNHSIKKGQRNRYQGLTMWTPNINIFRDPRWGRGQETYGEDPYLTSRLGVAFVTGLQGDDPQYFKVIATPKHYAVHSGPEHNRHSFDAFTTKKDLWETYLPAFKATVTEGKAYSVMSAYNRYLGSSATASRLLLTDILRDQWGFKGYVVSDCGAVSDIYRFHKIVKTAEEASALAVRSGCDLNCGNTYSHLVNSVKSRLITEKDIDKALKRLILARIKLGLFNPPEKIPFSEYADDQIESKEHQELALQTARESIVLLKNEDRTLPVSKNIGSIVVFGPNANDRQFLLGNYFGMPTYRTTILEGIKNKVSKDTKVYYFKGTNLTDDHSVFDVIGKDRFEGKVKVEYFDNTRMKGSPVYKNEEDMIDFEWGGSAPIDILEPGKYSVRYSGILRSDISADVLLKIDQTGGSYRFFLDGKEILSGKEGKAQGKEPVAVKMVKDRKYNFRLEYRCTNPWIASVQLLWNKEAVLGEKYRTDMIKKSDMIIFVGGITARLEGEEMPVEIEGFYKGDRTSLKLPKVQHELLKKLHATGKKVIFVMTTGSALAVNWEQENLPAIMNVWYPGQAGGKAVADVLFGDYNPSGKLPVTFYRSVNDLPDFEDYNMKGRTYRYFKGEVLYPFGYGLSYSDFSFSKPVFDKPVMDRNDTVTVTTTVTNTGGYGGETVVQLYVSEAEPGALSPLRSLKGFKKIYLKKGESKIVSFALTAKNLSVVNKEGKTIIKPGKYNIYIGEDSATSNKKTLNIK